MLLHTQASGNKELIEKSTLSELSTIEIIEGAKNNLPDEIAQYAASRIKEVAESMSNQDILLVLISGGGSALLPYPVEGITLEEKLKTIKVLASRGATIHELNTVRKNLSDIKGGKLAEAAFPAKVYITLSLINTFINFSVMFLRMVITRSLTHQPQTESLNGPITD